MGLFGNVMGFFGFGDTAATVPPPRPEGQKPDVGEASGPQNQQGASGRIASGSALLPGVYAGSGSARSFPSIGSGSLTGAPIDLFVEGAIFGWNGYGLTRPVRGAYQTYRLMSLDPVLQLVWSLITAPILSSTWSTHKATPDVPDAWEKLIQDMIMPQRRGLLSESLRYLQSGWRPFEKVWEIRDGRYWVRLKPLLPDLTTILYRPENGSFAGITQGGTDKALDAGKCWIVTNEPEAGNLYGQSRHEAAYEPWASKQATRWQAYKLRAKLSGVLPILKYPIGATPMPGQGEMDNAQLAELLIAALALGNGCCLPQTMYTAEELSQRPELAGLTPWVLDFYDAGNIAPAQTGMIEQCTYDDKLLFRAWRKPERSGLEASSGTRADAKSHSDNAAGDSELIDDDIAGQLTGGIETYGTPGVVDDVLVTNFGPNAKGAVVVRPAPLVDRKVEVYTAILTAALQNAQIAPTLIRGFDMDEIAEHLDIATKEGGSLNDLFETDAPDQNETAGAVNDLIDAMKAGQPPANGNGRITPPPPPRNGNGRPVPQN